MAMGEKGMGNMMEMGRQKNTLPMMAARGPTAGRDGGMFTVLKVRAGLTSYADPGWYQHQGSLPTKLDAPPLRPPPPRRV